MKCPRCWTEKAYLREVPSWKRLLMACALLRPMKCQHCYHKFVVFWPQTIGQQVRPPVLRPPTVRPTGPSYAAQVQAAARVEKPPDSRAAGEACSRAKEAA